MSDQINLSLLSSYLKTTYHSKEVLMAIDQLQTAFFQRQQSFLKTLETEITFPLSETLKKLAEEDHVALDNAAETDSFFSQIREAIQAIPVLTLTLGILPTLAMIDSLHQWLQLNVNKQLVLDFKLDDSLI